MKRKRFTEEQIIRMLKEYESGHTTKEICRLQRKRSVNYTPANC